jgi:Gram-negative bacterial TonB protein C-terminal
MRKSMFIILILCLSATFAIGQTEPENWQTYSPENEEFSVETPAAMTAKTFFTDKVKGVFTGSYRLKIYGNYYFVFSENKESGSYFVNELVAKYQASETIVNFGDLSARQFKFADDEGFYHQILLVRTKNRFYTFYGLSENDNDSSLSKFFGSLKFNESREQPKNSVTENKLADAITKLPVKIIVGTEDLVRGNVVNLPTQTPSLSTDKPVVNTFKILSQPRASYTDFARRYGIAGAIQLKVMFLSNGTIGEIKVLSKLPFGLTNAAINAAKSIEFVPAPVSIAKTVEYRFILY